MQLNESLGYGEVVLLEFEYEKLQCRIFNEEENWKEVFMKLALGTQGGWSEVKDMGEKLQIPF